MGRIIQDQTDLRGFTSTARNLVLDALGRGWTAYLSNKGHAVMHWQHGGTEAVARYLDGKRALENSKAALARVERTHQPDTQTEGAVEVQPENKLVPWFKSNGKKSYVVLTDAAGETFACAICLRTFETPGGASKHATKTHGRAAVLAMQVEAESKPEPVASVEVAEPPSSPSPSPSPITLDAVLDIVRSELATDLAVERQRNRELRESLTAVRDLLTELLGDE